MTAHQQLRKLAEAATPGPWHVTAGGDFQEVRPSPEMSAPVIIWDGAHMDETGEWIDSPDVEFVAAADPQTVLALLDEIHALRQGQGRYSA